MGLYGNIFLENNNKFLNEDLESLLIKGIIEFGLDEFDDENEVLEEGANIEYAKIFMSYKKEFNSLMKESKKALKNKEFKLATDKVQAASDVLTKMKKEIKKIPSDTSSAIVGTIFSILESIAGVILLVFIYSTGLDLGTSTIKKILYSGGSKTSALVAGNIVAALPGFGIGANIGKKLIIGLTTVVNTSKDFKNDKVNNSDALNIYRQKIISNIDYLRISTINLKAVIKEKEKKESKK